MSFLSKLTKELFGNLKGLSFNNRGLLQYPLDLTSTPRQQVVMLTAYTKEGEKVVPQTIYLPCPAGISFSDSAAFGTIDLGILGTVGAGAVEAAVDASGQGVTAAATAGVNSIVNQASTLKGGQAATIAAEMTPFAEQANLAARALSNPNTNSNFTGNTVRQFSFSFKMIANSEAEADAIRQIHQRFRYYTYAKPQSGENKFTLDYPPIWSIKFIDFETGKENKFIPAIYSSYLTTVNTNFNAGQNIFFTDGAPLEVDMSITYQETRVLTRDDLIAMESGQMGERQIGSDGQPSMIQAASPSQLKSPSKSESQLSKIKDNTTKRYKFKKR